MELDLAQLAFGSPTPLTNVSTRIVSYGFVLLATHQRKRLGRLELLRMDQSALNFNGVDQYLLLRRVLKIKCALSLDVRVY